MSALVELNTQSSSNLYKSSQPKKRTLEETKKNFVAKLTDPRELSVANIELSRLVVIGTR